MGGVKVMSGNLVHPRSRVTWQVRAEIRLTRKTLPGGGVAETKQTGREQHTLSPCPPTRLNTVLIQHLF